MKRMADFGISIRDAGSCSSWPRRTMRVSGGASVLDLRVSADPVVVAAEVRLAVGEEDRLVARVSQSGHGEVPPLREESCRDKHNERNGDAAEEPPLLDDPADRAPVCELQAAQRVGLGVALGRTVGVVVLGGAVAVGS